MSLRLSLRSLHIPPGSIRHYRSRAPSLLTRFDYIPIDLARVQAGQDVRLRDYERQRALGRRSYDLKLTADGLVLPTEGEYFTSANGCSLRPPTSYMFYETVCNFPGDDVPVFLIKEGTRLPKSLVLLHEHTDHYSMQCTKPMSLPKLNQEITRWLHANSRQVTALEYMQEYPMC